MGKINKKILLINPSYGKNDYSSMYTVPPLGIGYVGAYLKELGHEVRFCDFENTRIKEKEISDLIKNYDPDYVGIGGMTAHYLSAIKIFNIVKDIDNLIPTIYGGIHASAMPEYIMITNPSIDFIIVGEGELTFSELIKFNETDKDYYSEIDGLVWRKKGVGKVIMNRPREMIYNLDSLPNPWNILNPLDYQKGIVHSSIYKRMPTAPIITTRGCPYKCTYCAARVVLGSKIRIRSAKNVVDEIEFLINNFGIKEIKINDDNFTFNYNHARSICEEILDRGLDIVWACSNGVRADKVDYSLLKLMKKAGCYYLAFGFESGSDNILKLYKKSLNKERAIQAVKIAKNLGFFTQGFFLMAHPEERREDLEMTKQFINKTSLDRINLAKVTPLPGTELFDYYLEHGFMDLENMDWTYTNFEVKNNYLSKKELDWWYTEIMKTFYLRPSKIGRTITSVKDIHQSKFYYRVVKDLLRMYITSRVR